MAATPYMPGTKFEMRHYGGPVAMRKAAFFLDIELIWYRTGDPVNDPEHYIEHFTLRDNYLHTEEKGLTRKECEEYVYHAYLDEISR